MATHCPPQLHLSLPLNSTSFKRSFEQFGFDLEGSTSNQEASSASRSPGYFHSSTEGSERTKRARGVGSLTASPRAFSSSRSSPFDGRSNQGASSAYGSQEADSSVSTSFSPDVSALDRNSSSGTRVSQTISDLPTHNLQGVELPYAARESVEPQSGPPTVHSFTIPDFETRHLPSFQRYEALDGQTRDLRQPGSRGLPRSLASRLPFSAPSPPPTLPPLSLSDVWRDRSRDNTGSPLFMFPPSNPFPPLPESYYFSSSQSTSILSRESLFPTSDYSLPRITSRSRVNDRDRLVQPTPATSSPDRTTHDDSLISTLGLTRPRSHLSSSSEGTSPFDSFEPFPHLETEPRLPDYGWSSPFLSSITQSSTAPSRSPLAIHRSESLVSTTSSVNDSPSLSPVGGQPGRLIRETEAWLSSVESLSYPTSYLGSSSNSEQGHVSQTSTSNHSQSSLSEADLPETGFTQTSSGTASTSGSQPSFQLPHSASSLDAMSDSVPRLRRNGVPPSRPSLLTGFAFDRQQDSILFGDWSSRPISRRFPLVNDLTPVDDNSPLVSAHSTSSNHSLVRSSLGLYDHPTNASSTSADNSDSELRRRRNAHAEIISQLSNDLPETSTSASSEEDPDLVFTPLRNYIARGERTGRSDANRDPPVTLDGRRDSTEFDARPWVRRRAPVTVTDNDGVSRSESYLPAPFTEDVEMSDSSQSDVQLNRGLLDASSRSSRAWTVPLRPLLSDDDVSFSRSSRRSPGDIGPTPLSNRSSGTSSSHSSLASNIPPQNRRSAIQYGPRHTHSQQQRSGSDASWIDSFENSVERLAELGRVSARQSEANRSASTRHSRAPSLPPLNFGDSSFSVNSGVSGSSSTREGGRALGDGLSRVLNDNTVISSSPVDDVSTERSRSGAFSLARTLTGPFSRNPFWRNDNSEPAQRDGRRSAFALPPRAVTLRTEPIEPELITQGSGHAVESIRDSLSSANTVNNTRRLLRTADQWRQIDAREESRNVRSWVSQSSGEDGFPGSLMRQFLGRTQSPVGTPDADIRPPQGRSSSRSRNLPSPSREERESGIRERSVNRARRAARLRAGLEADNARDRDIPRLGMFGLSRRGPLGGLGDYMRDEDFDSSYEGLIMLSAALGDVKPRATPENVISSLKSATYKEWAGAGCDKRCPICLDDYNPNDKVTKLSDCAHWLHKECLGEWLRSAKTCPVCRKDVAEVEDSTTSTSRPGSATWNPLMADPPWRVL